MNKKDLFKVVLRNNNNNNISFVSFNRTISLNCKNKYIDTNGKLWNLSEWTIDPDMEVPESAPPGKCDGTGPPHDGINYQCSNNPHESGNDFMDPCSGPHAYNLPFYSHYKECCPKNSTPKPHTCHTSLGGKKWSCWLCTDVPPVTTCPDNAYCTLAPVKGSNPQNICAYVKNNITEKSPYYYGNPYRPSETDPTKDASKGQGCLTASGEIRHGFGSNTVCTTECTDDTSCPPAPPNVLAIPKCNLVNPNNNKKYCSLKCNH